MKSLLSNPVVRIVGAVAAIVLALFLPQLLGGGNKIYTTFALIAIFAIMSYGMDIILSDLGEVSLGQTVFWAAGAYTTALLVIKLQWDPLLSLVAAIAVSMAIAIVLGLITIRTREFVFSLVTYASAIIAMAIVTNVELFGGSDGLVGMPVLEIGPYNAGSAQNFYPVALISVVLVIYAVARFRRSRLGLTARMTHMNPELTTTMGFDVRKTRAIVFMISAPASALAGWLYAFQRSYVGPDLLDQFFLLLMLTAVILPGKRILFGPLIATAILVIQQQHFSFGGDVDKIVLGGVLAVVLLTSKDGLAGWFRGIASARRKRRDEPAPAAPASVN
ncbi:branched-chain amino acid ABC transporter permease [Agrococcus citreus]|uniref:Branched-chain amino acid ABC transporter permease n=1 Tax=Agrococcus citreus TaxID=84643 RepID=A0ABP4JL43_9MICO